MSRKSKVKVILKTILVCTIAFCVIYFGIAGLSLDKTNPEGGTGFTEREKIVLIIWIPIMSALLTLYFFAYPIYSALEEGERLGYKHQARELFR